MAAISLQPGIIYGPVLSRRLGRSLGVNLLSVKHKVCSFDCIYCQYGRTTELTLYPDRSKLPTITEVLIALEKALLKPRTIETITFSGNGEPTLHPDFLEIVQGIIRLRDKLRPSAKLALLSNASRINAPEIIQAIDLIEIPVLKLDAGNEETFMSINQPVDSIQFKKVCEGLKRFSPMIIQSALFDGVVSNIHGNAYEAWASTLCAIRPRKVHIYSTERPTASKDVECLSSTELKEVQYDLQTRFNLQVEAF